MLPKVLLLCILRLSIQLEWLRWLVLLLHRVGRPCVLRVELCVLLRVSMWWYVLAFVLLGALRSRLGNLEAWVHLQLVVVRLLFGILSVIGEVFGVHCTFKYLKFNYLFLKVFQTTAPGVLGFWGFGVLGATFSLFITGNELIFFFLIFIPTVSIGVLRSQVIGFLIIIPLT